MTMKFNADGNHGKEIVAEELDEEYEEIEEVEESSNSSNNNGEKKKLIKMLVILLIVVVGIILVVMFLTSLTNGNKSYEEIEEIMISAAEDYFEDNPQNLPKKDGGAQTIDVAVLVSEGRMKDLSKYTDSACSGSVIVEKAGTSYIYIPNLNCGDTYASQKLYEKVKEDNEIVSSGYGLYNKGGNYVFRGEKVDNYVQLDEALWRIVKITSGNNLVLVLDEPLGTLVPWDDRYNQQTSYNAGINNYASSRIKEKLDDLYKMTEDETGAFLSNRDRAKLESFNMCTGKRSATETGVEQAVECKEVSRDQKIGLLTAADYMNASTDPSCRTAESLNCQNYNYLITDNNWWLVTASPANTYDAYMVAANSGLKVSKTNMYARIRPVIQINANVLYKSGSGTEADPYIVK